MINTLFQYSVFSPFYLRSAYIKLVSSKHKHIGFKANNKLYKFPRIAYGVKNEVAAFQRIIYHFAKEENLTHTYAYLNNVRQVVLLNLNLIAMQKRLLIQFFTET